MFKNQGVIKEFFIKIVASLRSLFLLIRYPYQKNYPKIKRRCSLGLFLFTSPIHSKENNISSLLFVENQVLKTPFFEKIKKIKDF
ncbi:hypothetical protein EGCR1_17035 (plasmid) [Enterococcus gilvus]|jgi:hypothetical protein|nr:hypothetical protein EGCR1_17035 [Enterococcus gilvus]